MSHGQHSYKAKQHFSIQRKEQMWVSRLLRQCALRLLTSLLWSSHGSSNKREQLHQSISKFSTQMPFSSGGVQSIMEWGLNS